MNLRRGCGLGLLLLCVAATCQNQNPSVTMKPGASPGAMAADERECRAASGDDASYEQCMRDRGYLLPGQRTPGGG